MGVVLCGSNRNSTSKLSNVNLDQLSNKRMSYSELETGASPQGSPMSDKNGSIIKPKIKVSSVCPKPKSPKNKKENYEIKLNKIQTEKEKENTESIRIHIEKCEKFQFDKTKEGYGTYNFSDGSFYRGYFKNDLQHGQGYLLFSNGDSYSGEFQKGKFHGNGTLDIKNKETYFGQFHEGKRCGKGKVSFHSCLSYVQFEGNFLNDLKNGHGKIQLRNGNFIMGNFENDSIKTGEIQFWNGDSYIGDIESFYMNGFGKLKYANSDYFIGHFSENMKDGFGKYCFSIGDVYEGEFKYDTMHGRGKNITKNNKVFEGIFNSGEFLVDPANQSLDLSDFSLREVRAKGSFNSVNNFS
jgi:hypothetical protein